MVEARGNIRTRHDAADGRRSLVALSPEGEALQRRIAPRSIERDHEIEALIGAKRLERMLDDLHHVQSIKRGTDPAP